MNNSNSSQILISIPDGIKEMLEEKLIQSSVGIEEIYSWIFDYFNHQFNGREEPNGFKIFVNELSSAYANVKLKELRTIGIDFPILLSKGTKKPIVMVCAMDPLRDETDVSEISTEIGMWVPFSAINNPNNKNYKMKPSDKRNLSFFHTLLETNDLYLTDAFKLFYREGKELSNGQTEFKKLSVHREILEKEIQLVQPEAIVSLGNHARDSISQILNLHAPSWSDTVYKTQTCDGKTVIMVPHISGSASGYKAPILKNENYKSIEGKDNERYARIIVSVIGN